MAILAIRMAQHRLIDAHRKLIGAQKPQRKTTESEPEKVAEPVA